MKKRQIYLPLFWKFTLAIILIVFIFGGINAFVIFQNVQKSLEQESEKSASIIGKSLAEEAITPLLFENYIDVQKILDGAKKLDSTVVYAFITDKNDKLILASYNSTISPELIKANELKPGSKSNVVLISLVENNTGRIIRDIALPIMDKQLGTIRVGLSEERINRNVSKTISVFWLMVGFFLIIGIIGAFVFSYFITNPIKSIQNAADNLDFDSLEKSEISTISIRQNLIGKIPVFFRAKDEIDLLIEKFNDMIKRLSEAYRELKNAESQLIQSEKLATIGTIFAGLAHEINNPVSGIQNCLRRMNKDPQNIEQNKRYLSLMEEASKRIEVVIKNLLNYSRVEDMQFEAVDINELIENALLLVAHKLENSRITLTRENQFVKLNVRGSKVHIEQIIVNLLLNAIDAIEADDENEVKTIQISVYEDKDFMKMKIQDSGIGISQEEVNKIFEPFFTTKTASKGTGLGLSIVYNIVNSHNGKIEVESEGNKGTAFIISLPKYVEQ